MSLRLASNFGILVFVLVLPVILEKAPQKMPQLHVRHLQDRRASQFISFVGGCGRMLIVMIAKGWKVSFESVNVVINGFVLSSLSHLS